MTALDAAAAGPLAGGGPTALGLPSFIVGAVALGQVLAGGPRTALGHICRTRCDPQ